MQGANALLNTVTIPPGAGVNSPRLVMDGVRGAFFLYGPGGQLIGSWASQAGTDPYGNAYPQGFFGAQGVISGTDFLVYAGTPGLGTLIGSWSDTGGTDIYGNVYPQGFMLQPDQAQTVQNLFNVLDVNGNTVVSIDNSGNLSAVSGNFQSVSINGLDLFNDILNPMPQGIVNRGWCGTPPWPSTAIGTTETPLLELDTVIPVGREYRFQMLPATILLNAAPTAPTQIVMHLKPTTDGSTPSTSTPDLSGHSPLVQTIPVANLLNHQTPYKSFILGNGGASDIQYHMLITGNIQSGSFKFASFLELLWEDLGSTGGEFANSATVLGSGSGGGSSQQTYTKNYVATEFASYYGSQASYGGGANSLRSHNAGSGYQGAASGYLSGTGDQYCFSRFNYGQIASDLGSGTINWVKLRLTNQHFWYNGGGNVIVGWTSYTGAWGSTFVPGAGTHMAQEVYHMNEGATVTRTMGSWLKSAITSGFTSIVIGTSASYSSAGDLNNYGYWAAAGNVNTAPQLTINYTK